MSAAITTLSFVLIPITEVPVTIGWEACVVMSDFFCSKYCIFKGCVKKQIQKTMQRVYFYTLDLHGRLYLRNAYPKNIATNFKDLNFLKFFYRNLEFNATGKHSESPMVSICGTELNYLDSVEKNELPIVFDKIEKETIFAQHKQFQILPENFLYSMSTNRLYLKHNYSLNEDLKKTTLSSIRYPEFGVVDDSLIQHYFINSSLGNDIRVEKGILTLSHQNYHLQMAN
eukprot:NODE_38_length_35257_cov_0.939047.p17 type:complete len:228 gc:universal NODE_38_length_35257_cov_0.939047:19864-20547(+)